MSAPVISGFNNTVLASLYSGSGDWLGINSSIPILVGDTLIVQGVTSPNSFVVVVNTDGTYTVACGGNPARQKFLRYVYHQSPATYDYYIGPSGSDSNPGTQSSPWAITAINTKQSTYAGHNLGILPGTYNCYALVQAGSFNQPALVVNGGPNTFVGTGSISGTTLTITGTTSGSLAIGSYLSGGSTTLNAQSSVLAGTQIISGSGSTWTVNNPQTLASTTIMGYTPTLIQSTTPLGAILTAANPSGGGYPTNECAIIGQGQYGALPPNPGNCIIDGLYVTRGFEQGVAFYMTGQGIGAGVVEGGVYGIEIRNCEIYDIGGNDNDNVAGIFFQGVTAAWVHNNKIHSIQPPTAGQNPDDVACIYSYNSYSNIYEYNELYDCNNAMFEKASSNGNHTFRYNYVECMGLSPQNALHGCSGGNPGDVLTINNNILKCPSANLGDMSLGSSQSTQSVLFYNNACQFGSGQTGISYPANSSQTFKHWNNIYIPSSSTSEGTIKPGAATLTSDFNNYGGTTSNVITLPSGGLTFSAAKSAGYDTHSANVAPSFNSTGTVTSGGPLGYKVAPGTAGSASGSFPGNTKIDGSGSKCDMGAWGGANPPSVIGYTAPQAPATQLDGPSPVWVNEIAPIWAGALFRSNVQPGVVFATVNFASTSYCYSTEGDALTFAIYSGALPPGLALTTTGLLQGTCTTNGISCLQDYRHRHYRHVIDQRDMYC